MNFGYKIGVDLGTATVLIRVQGKGLLLNEPSVVAVNQKSGKVLAVGEAAKEMLGRTPEAVEAIRPLREGVISDFEATEVLLKELLARACKGWLWRVLRPTVMVCVPSVITPVERRAVEDACRQAGMGKVYLIREPIAAAIGAGIDVQKPEGCLVVDIGGGTTDVCVISMCEPVVDATVKVAGDVFDQAIIRYVRRTYNLLIGDKTAEKVKFEVGFQAAFTPDCPGLEVKGRNLLTGMPGQVFIEAEDVRLALEEPLAHIVEAIRSVIERTPPELLADVSEKGIVLTGGGAMLKGLEEFLQLQLSMPVKLAEDPVTCVVRGTEKALDFPDLSIFLN